MYAAPDSNNTSEIINTEITTDPDMLYTRYEDNSFELMTKEFKDKTMTSIKETFINLTGTVKNFIWGLVKCLWQLKTL